MIMADDLPQPLEGDRLNLKRKIVERAAAFRDLGRDLAQEPFASDLDLVPDRLGIVMIPAFRSRQYSHMEITGRPMNRRQSKKNPYGDLQGEPEPSSEPVPCWLCSRPLGKTTVWHHPVPKSRGGRDVVPMHPICQQTLTANFSNAELQRHGPDVEGLLANPDVRNFVDWVAKKDPDFTASITRKKR